MLELNAYSAHTYIKIINCIIESNICLQLMRTVLLLIESEIELAKFPSLAPFGNCGNMSIELNPQHYSTLKVVLHLNTHHLPVLFQSNTFDTPTRWPQSHISLLASQSITIRNHRDKLDGKLFGKIIWNLLICILTCILLYFYETIGLFENPFLNLNSREFKKKQLGISRPLWARVPPPPPIGNSEFTTACGTVNFKFPRYRLILTCSSANITDIRDFCDTW